MRKKLKFICCLLTSMVLLNSMTVFALPDDKLVENAQREQEEKLTESNSTGELYDAINAIMHCSFSDETKKSAVTESVSLVISALKTERYTDEAIAGVLANMQHESHFDPYAFEGNYNWFEAYANMTDSSYTYPNHNVAGGIGLCQWTYGRHTEFNNYCQGTGDYVTINCNWRPSKGAAYQNVSYASKSGTQIAFLIQENVWNHNEANAGLSRIDGLNEFKTLTDAQAATRYWCACWEVPANYKSEGEKRAADAPAWLSIVRGNYNWGDFISETQASDMGSQLVGAGYWSEDDLSAFCKLVEMNVDDILKDALRENLSQDELNGLVMWERNVHQDIEENGLIVWCRRIVMLFGILFTMWVSLIYFAYWFDRINNFFYIDMLGVLTFGHLHMSDTEEECTFHINNMGQEGRKTVNHRTILWICLVGIAFGVLIITGQIYTFLQFIIYQGAKFVRRFLV